MEHPRSALSHQPNSSQVCFRFLLRLVLLCLFANLGPQGFAQTFATLLAFSAVFCAIAGTLRREALLGPSLTHWDEAAAYAILGGLVSAVA
jgi:hypothetical protein